MIENINARIQQKTDTLVNWNNNPLPLLSGEVAWVLTANNEPMNFKVGTGNKRFSDLPYWIKYDQGAYTPYVDTPTQSVAYTVVGEGIYGSVVVPPSTMAVLGWDGTEWSINSSIDIVGGDLTSLEEFKDNLTELLGLNFDGSGEEILIPNIDNGTVNSQYTNSANFIYENNSILNSKFVKGLNILVAVEGILTVSIVENAGLANFTVIKEINLNLVVGKYYYEINEQLTSVQTIAIGKQGNTGIFKYVSGVNNPIGGFFRQRNNTTGAWTNSPNNNLNIGVVIEVGNNDSTTIDDLYSKTSILRHKKIAIVSDSISTYASFIPTGNASFYPTNNVTNVNLTWWKKFIDYTGADLILNDSWSGSRASNTGTGSLQTRLDRIPTNTDYILLFIGTNDLGNGVVFGNVDLTTPFNTSEFTDAYCNALDYWSTNRPNTKIICFSLLRRYISSSGVLYTNGGQTSDTYSQRIKEIADLYCCEYIDLKNIGINSKNQSTYLFDGLHPNSKGMEALFEYLARVL